MYEKDNQKERRDLEAIPLWFDWRRPFGRGVVDQAAVSISLRPVYGLAMYDRLDAGTLTQHLVRI